MRLNNSKKGALTAFFSNVVKILIGFISQKIFIITLGTEYLGLNGLFNNIISLLTITELGIGSAIIYNLYEPIAKNDINKVKQLIDFYKKAYKYIAFAILVIGIVIIPFVPYFVGESNILNITVYYILYLCDTLLTYGIAYKSSLINAYQKNYVLNIIHIIYLIVMNSLQIFFLLGMKMYFVYLIIKIFCRIFENLLISKYYKKNYANLNNIKSEPMDIEVKKDIFKKVKALVIHKISSFVVTGTDNLIISKYLNLIVVGLYSNYSMIINTIQTLLVQIFNSITSSVGNLLTEHNCQKSYNVYSKMLFLNYFIASFSAICLYNLIEPFITLWIGTEYLLNKTTLFVLIMVFYSNTMRNAPMAFKSAAGIFVEDKFVPIIESIINIAISIILVKCIGLTGVFIGTFISSLILHFYSYPIFVYKKIFNKNPLNYILEQLKYFCMFSINFVIIAILISFFKFNNCFIQLVFNGVICFAIFIINVLIYRKSDNFTYLISILKK